MYPGTAKHVHRDELSAFQPRAPRGNQSDVTAAFVLINPRQIRRAEVTVQHFLTELAVPITRLITLRQSPHDGNYWQQAISETCGVIREKIMEFARACGLTVSSVSKIPWNSTSEDWFTESLVQGSFLLGDLVKLGEKVWSTIDHYFDAHNVSLHRSNVSAKEAKSVSQEFKIDPLE